MAKKKPRARIFLNLPYDGQFQRLYLAYICGIQAFGMEPHVTLEIPGGARRLDRIFMLIKSCQFSLHDLSRVQQDRARPATPRFNMPFELGLAVAWEMTAPKSHMWFVAEAVNHRLTKSLSDLNGTDPYIHGGTIQGVFQVLGNALVRKGRQPSILQMSHIYREVRASVPGILKRCGGASVYQARAFEEISFAANVAASGIVR